MVYFLSYEIVSLSINILPDKFFGGHCIVMQKNLPDTMQNVKRFWVCTMVRTRKIIIKIKKEITCFFTIIVN